MTHWTEKYIGLPYADAGRTRDGLDCWGLARLVYENELGVMLPSYAGGYTGHEERAEIAALLSDAKELPGWLSVTDDDIRPFDLVLFRRGRLDSHVGIVAAPGRMLHITAHTTANIQTYFISEWQTRLTGTWRRRELQVSQ